jgi:hypothetical protein
LAKFVIIVPCADAASTLRSSVRDGTDRAPEVPPLETAVDGEPGRQVLGVVLVELAGPERFVDGIGDHLVVHVVLAEAAVRVERDQRVRPMGADRADDLLAQCNLAHVGQPVSGMAQFDDLGHAEDPRCLTELVCVGHDGVLFGQLVRVPAIVGDPQHDHSPAMIGPQRDRAADEERNVVGVGNDEQNRATVTGFDNSNRSHVRRL